jgi:hypothetical protein
MLITPNPGEVAINTALGSFLTAILDSSVEIVQGQDNRVPQPRAPNHVVFTPTRTVRLATNVDSSDDAAFTGSIAGAVLTVSALRVPPIGMVVPGRTLFGTGVLPLTVIGAQLTGTPGGTGTYAITPSQTLGPTALSAGAKTIMMETELVYQIDVHGPLSQNNTQVIHTLMRDSFANEFFDALGIGVSPLHCDDPKQIPFTDAEQQWEDRWVIEALLQANVVLSVPQQYADSVVVNPVSVDATYPP